MVINHQTAPAGFSAPFCDVYFSAAFREPDQRRATTNYKIY
jgi:hypothetical protein